MCCRSWLREAQLGVTAADEAAPLLENPLRNGTLLGNLAGSLSCCFFGALLDIPIITSQNKCLPADTQLDHV